MPFVRDRAVKVECRVRNITPVLRMQYVCTGNVRVRLNFAVSFYTKMSQFIFQFLFCVTRRGREFLRDVSSTVLGHAYSFFDMDIQTGRKRRSNNCLRDDDTSQDETKGLFLVKRKSTNFFCELSRHVACNDSFIDFVFIFIEFKIG